LFDEKFLRRNQMSFVKAMLERSQRGISFPAGNHIAAIEGQAAIAG
jgi:hypothetical protein